jgi:hypothetical protein
MTVFSSPNRALALLACGALLNIAGLNQEDNRVQILKDDGVIVLLNALSSPDRQMIFFTL